MESVHQHRWPERRTWGIGGLLVLLAVGLCAPAAAQTDGDARLEVTAGVLRDWPPHYALDETGQPTGFAVDIMNEVARRANLRVTVQIYEQFWDLQEALSEGRIDLIPNLGITPERLERYAFTPPVETFVLALFVRADSTGPERLEELRSERIAVIRSNAAVNILQEQGYSTVLYDELELALFDLLAGHVDALAYPSSVLWARVREIGVEERIREMDGPLAEIRRGMAVRIGDTELHERLSRAVEEVVGSAAFREIYTRWYGPEPPFWTVSRVLWLTGLLLIALGSGVAFWRYRVLAQHNRALRAHIAERDAAQAALAESEAKYRQIVETTAEGVWVIDEKAVTTFVNQRMAELMGLSASEMLGRTMYDFFDEEMTRVAETNFERRREGIVEQHDFRLLRADGGEVQVLMSASPIVDQGEFRGALALVSDVTERRRLQSQLRESQKLEALGRLAGGVAHDFNNLLVIISASATLVKLSLGEGSPVLPDLEQIEDACARARALTAQLLTFSRQQLSQPRVLRPAERITNAAPLLGRLLGEDVALRLPEPSDGGAVEIDPIQLDQIVFNLAVNARDAMPHGGSLDIRVEDVTMPGDEELPAGDYVAITVEDTGHGMTAEVKRKIFEPFFTTKSSGRGTGLGLSTCYGLVSERGGRIVVESQPERGARFVVLLPRVSAEKTATEPSGVAQMAAKGRTFLLVEDDRSVRRLVRRILEREGHTVYGAASAEEALELLENGQSKPDLLLTDIVLPGMSGRALAKRLMVLMESLRVIYMSGYVDRELPDLEQLSERETFLAKPFTPSELSQAVAEQL